MDQNPWIIPPASYSRPRRRKQLQRRAKQHDPDPQLAVLFKSFSAYLTVEKGSTPSTIATYQRCFDHFLEVVERRTRRRPALISRFTSELVRTYHYEMSQRGWSASTVRQHLAVLSSFGKWATATRKLNSNPLDQVVKPKRRFKLPDTPRWESILQLLDATTKLRDKALLALLAYGALHRSEVVGLNVGDVDAGFGLRRVMGKGGAEIAVPLPATCLRIVGEYLEKERPQALPLDPLFLVLYYRRGRRVERRMTSHRVWKVVAMAGVRNGMPRLHPHSFRHACAVELLKRTRNLKVVQDHLRHTDIGSTTVYARLFPEQLQEAIKVFDAG